jgi:hypothetical protein
MDLVAAKTALKHPFDVLLHFFDLFSTFLLDLFYLHLSPLRAGFDFSCTLSRSRLGAQSNPPRSPLEAT